MRHLYRRLLTADQAADLAGELAEDEFDERVQPICVGPVTDGAMTLSDAAYELHGFALWLIELEREGWQLVHESEDAHLHVINSDPTKRLYEPALNEA